MFITCHLLRCSIPAFAGLHGMNDELSRLNTSVVYTYRFCNRFPLYAQIVSGIVQLLISTAYPGLARLCTIPVLHHAFIYLVRDGGSWGHCACGGKVTDCIPRRLGAVAQDSNLLFASTCSWSSTPRTSILQRCLRQRQPRRPKDCSKDAAVRHVRSLPTHLLQ